MTVRSEIDFIKAYNKVQKIRYPNAFYLVYDVEEEIMEERIPPLIIQNFVENSTKYALKADTEIEILVVVLKRRGETSDLRLRQRQRHGKRDAGEDRAGGNHQG